MGIALAHFDLTMQEEGIDGRFVTDVPELDLPEGLVYIATYVKD